MSDRPSAPPPVTFVSTRTTDGVRLAGRLWRPADGGHDVAGGRTPARDVPVYVVAHGFTGSTAERRVLDICEHLAGRGAPVLAFDFRGHGASGGGSTLGEIEVLDVAAAVAAAREHHPGPVVVVGWSMGGSVVLRHAGLGGDADAVVSISSPGLWYERGTRAMRLVHWAAETRRGRLVCRLLTGTRLTQGWEVLPESPVEVVGRITCPLLLVHGEQDHYFPVRHARALASAAPSATCWLEPGMGHAETATTPELLDRVDAWVRAAVAALPGRSGVVGTSPAPGRATMTR